MNEMMTPSAIGKSLRFTLCASLSPILLLFACAGRIKLVDLPKTTATLNLSKEQQEVIHPRISLIRDVVEDYEFEKGELEADYLRYRNHTNLSRLSRYEGGGFITNTGRERNEMRTKVRQFVMQRKRYAKEISKLIDEIKADLSPEQLVAFEEIKLPELELPDMLKMRPYEGLETIPGTRLRMPDDF